MSKAFANSAFSHVNETLQASEYITNKKKKYGCCCTNNNNINNSNFNKSQLYINLYTKLQLEEVITITDLSGNYPVYTTSNGILPPYNYIIDPMGELFGNTPCGLNNYLNYLTPTNLN